MSFELEQDGGFRCWRDVGNGAGVCFAGRGPDLDLAAAVRLLASPRVEPAWLRQVHSAAVVEAAAGCAGEADALLTGRRDLALAIVTADCVPVLIAGEGAGETPELAAIHAGWRGVASRIVPAAIERLESRPGGMIAWIGPAIGRCCYEVGEDVAARVVRGVGPEGGRFVLQGPRGRPHLDLSAAVEAQLRGAGVARIRRLARCTRCDPELWSYRRDGPSAGRNLALIYPLPPERAQVSAATRHRERTGMLESGNRHGLGVGTSKRSSWMRRLKTWLRWGTRQVLPAQRFRTVVHLMLASTVAALLISTREIESGDRYALSLAPTLPFGSMLTIARSEPPLALERAEVPWPFTLRPGQNLSDLLTSLGLDRGEAFAAATAAEEHVDVRRLRAGESGAAYFDPDGLLTRFDLGITGRGRLELTRAGDGWASGFRPSIRAVEARRIEGVLEDVLVSAVRERGGDPAVAYKMSDVLQWDLDFHRDLRKGDRFEVLYEAVHLDGEPAGVGAVLALAYENRGRRYEAYRFGEDGGYYDAEGKPLRKMFLRSPLPFSRVTSRFSHRRFHPVLKVHRPHYGVDYGAPVGTPVRVTANGTVELAGWTKGGGNTVKVRHPNGYLTAYLHLSRFAKGIRRGKRVRQEEIIGYVGSTGLATGPHLDYRVQQNGRWTDPMKLPNTPADPIPESEMEAFASRREELQARLGGDPVRL